MIAAPTAVLGLAICVRYIRLDPWRFCSLGLSQSRRLEARPTLPLMAQDLVLPHVILMLFMLLYTAIMVHVQIIARLFSFQPLLYWALAHFYLDGSPRTRTAIVWYALGYAAVGSILFANFYPPA